VLKYKEKKSMKQKTAFRKKGKVSCSRRTVALSPEDVLWADYKERIKER